MEIRNKTLYDKDLIMEYNKYYLRSYLKKNFLIISAISVVFIAYMLFKQEWMYALLLFGILVFYLAMTYVMQKLTIKRILKKSPLVSQPVLQTYVFRELDLEVTNIKSYTVNYTDLIRFKKGGKFYLLYTRDRKTFIIDFNGFDTKEQNNQFESFIALKMGLNKRG